MNDTNRILVVVDPAMRTGAALQRGAAMARLSGAELKLCLFDFDPWIGSYTDYGLYGDVLAAPLKQKAVEQFIAERMDWLTAEAAALSAQGLRVECEAVWAPVAHHAVIAKTVEYGANLVIKDLGPQRSLGALLRPLDWKLLRLLPADLMLVQSDAQPAPRRIAAAVDTWAGPHAPEALNEAIVRSALKWGLYADAEVHLAHAVPAPPVAGIVSEALRLSHENKLRMDAETFLGFADAHTVPQERRHLLSGDASESLADFTRKESIDLLVLGATYRSAWDGFLLGTTAEQLLTLLSCDVLMVKAPGFPALLRQHLDVDELVRRYAELPA